MVKKKKSILPILMGVGAIILLSKPTEAESLFGGFGGSGGGVEQPTLSTGIAPLGSSPNTPAFNIPAFNFPSSSPSYSTSPSEINPVNSKKNNLSSNKDNLESPSSFKFGGGKSGGYGYSGSWTPSEATIITKPTGAYTGYGSVVGSNKYTGGSGGRSYTPLTKKVKASGGSFKGESSLDSKKASSESEQRAESLWKRMGN